MYLGVADHMLAFYGKKMNPKAGLLLDQAITTSKVIANIPTWMGYFATWRVKCISISEAGEILVGCKRIEKGKSEASSLGASATVFCLAGGFCPLCHCLTVPTPGHSAVVLRR